MATKYYTFCKPPHWTTWQISEGPFDTEEKARKRVEKNAELYGPSYEYTTGTIEHTED